jgi:flagellar biosynthesis anti-sigma factor FlgM
LSEHGGLGISAEILHRLSPLGPRPPLGMLTGKLQEIVSDVDAQWLQLLRRGPIRNSGEVSMDTRNNVEGLKVLLGVSSISPERVPVVRKGSAPASDAPAPDKATLSNAGSKVLHTVSESDVRADKVAAVQTALAAGTYQIPASAVAGKVVDAMLGGGQTSES